jgi:hypothetical protein
MNESVRSKTYLNQKCRVIPEARSDECHKSCVAKVAPEASRAKGTLQIQVQIREPDELPTHERSTKE